MRYRAIEITTIIIIIITSSHLVLTSCIFRLYKLFRRVLLCKISSVSSVYLVDFISVSPIG